MQIWLDIITNTIHTRGSIDLSKLQREVSHQIWLNLEDGAGKLFLIITLSGGFKRQEKVHVLNFTFKAQQTMTVKHFLPIGITVRGLGKREKENIA